MADDVVDEAQLRDLIPGVLTALVHRGADFATAEDAVQEALVKAVEIWPNTPPDDPKGWLITTAWHRFLDLVRSETARHTREDRLWAEPPPGPSPSTDDTLQLYFLCAHPSLTSSSAVALTLRAVGGLTTRQVAQAYLVPEATMAQRISRAKRTVGSAQFDRPGDLHTVLRVLYLVFDAAAHALLWVFVRVFRMNANSARGLLGLDVEADDDEGGAASRNGSAGVPSRLTQV